MPDNLFSQRLPIFIYILSSSILVAHYGFIDRPLWFDEFLGFAFGSFDSSSEALYYIRKTTSGINHGQTGTYFLFNYFTLSAFGANNTLLRLPSIISLAFLFYATYVFMRSRKLGRYFALFALLLMAGQNELMKYAAEARPQLPLAAFSVGAFAYYGIPLSERDHLHNKIFGAVAIFGGVLIHPYFSLYWASAFLFWFMLGVRDKEIPMTLSGAVRFVNLPISVIGTIIYFSLAMLTWLPNHPSFTRNPWAFWWPKERSVIEQIVDRHFDFVTLFVAFAIILFSLLVLISSLFKPAMFREFAYRLMPPALLIALSIFLSMILVYLSYRSNYYILPRQWTASIALIALAVAWGAGIAYQWLNAHHNRIASILAIICTAGAAVEMSSDFIRFNKSSDKVRGPTYQRSLGEIQTSLDQTEITKLLSAYNLSGAGCDAFNVQSDWVPLARANIQIGGAVWPIFQNYYRDCVK